MEFFLDDLGRHLETIILLPLCLLSVFVIHEFGHYAAARMVGLKVDSVVFGRGRLLWMKSDGQGTLWRFHLWPFGAHVQVRSFEGNDALSSGKKLFVILSGPLANLLTPFVLFFVFFTLIGQPVVPTLVSAIEPDMPAYEAGLRPGDKILTINGAPVRSFKEITDHTYPYRTDPLIFTYSRDGVTHETSIMPVWANYKNLDGVSRSHGRIGLTTWQRPYDLKFVRSVAGQDVSSIDEARTALLSHMGQRIRIGLFSDDGKTYISEIDLSIASNKNLGNPEHRESRWIYLGSMRDNIYLLLSLSESAAKAASQAGEMIIHIARLPFNLLPMDKEWVSPDATVSGQTSWFASIFYVFVFFTSLCSCVIGLVNLLPFPKLDGGNALLLIGEIWRKRPLLVKEQAALIVMGVLLFYSAVFTANMGNVYGYWQFHINKAAAAEP